VSETYLNKPLFPKTLHLFTTNFVIKTQFIAVSHCLATLALTSVLELVRCTTVECGCICHGLVWLQCSESHSFFNCIISLFHHPPNSLFCVGWDIKPYSLYYFTFIRFYFNLDSILISIVYSIWHAALATLAALRQQKHIALLKYDKYSQKACVIH